MIFILIDKIYLISNIKRNITYNVEILTPVIAITNHVGLLP